MSMRCGVDERYKTKLRLREEFDAAHDMRPR